MMVNALFVMIGMDTYANNYNFLNKSGKRDYNRCLFYPTEQNGALRMTNENFNENNDENGNSVKVHYSYYDSVEFVHDMFSYEKTKAGNSCHYHCNMFNISSIADDDIKTFFENIFERLNAGKSEVYYRNGYFFVKNDDTLINFRPYDTVSNVETIPYPLKREYDGSLQISVSSLNKEFYKDVEKAFFEHFKEKIIVKADDDIKVTNLYKAAGDSTIRESNGTLRKDRPFDPFLYPNIPQGADKFINDYINSPEPILILSGEAGLGKSALICEILRRINTRYMYVIYDKEVMKDSDAYTRILDKPEKAVLVLEDAEDIVQSRETAANATMAKLLNMADGILKNNMKIIFTFNNYNRDTQIDEALTRPGRCFEFLEFPKIDKNYACQIAEKYNKTLDENINTYSLADIFNEKSNKIEKPKIKVGFTNR